MVNRPGTIVKTHIPPQRRFTAALKWLLFENFDLKILNQVKISVSKRKRGWGICLFDVNNTGNQHPQHLTGG